MQIELRPATAADAQFVYDVTEAAMRSYVEQTFGPWVPSFQQEIIGQSFDPATHQVIVVDGTTAGIIAAPDRGTHIQLEKLYLLPSFQGKGVGSHLLKIVLESARAKTRPVRLRVLVVNVAARRLYERFGFVAASSTAQHVLMEYKA